MTTPIVTFRGHRDAVNTLLCEEQKHPHTLVSGSDDGSCRLWDVRTARATRCINVKKAISGFSDDPDDYAVHSLTFGGNKKNDKLLYVAASNKILTFDLRQEGLILDSVCKEILQDNTDEINAISMHPSKQAKYLSAPDDNGDIRIFDVDSHTLFKTLSGQHTNLCMCAPFRPNAPWDLVSGGLDGCLLFWDFSRGRLKFKIDLTAGMQLTADAENTQATHASESQLFNPPFVHSVAFAPNGKALAAGLGDASVAIVDFMSKQIIRRLQNHQAIVHQVHFPAFRSDEWLLSSGNDSKITVWDYKRAADKTGSSSESFVVKQFDVREKPNAIATSMHQHFVHVADTSSEIAAYPLM